MGPKFELGIILAAGAGIRMRPLTYKLPKALLPSPANSLLAAQIRFLRPEVETLLVTKGYLSQEVENWALELGADGTVNTSGKGNAHFLRMLSPIYSHSTILVLTCDNVMTIDFEALRNDLKIHRGSHTVIGLEADLSIPGDRIIADGSRKISAIGPNIASRTLATGMQVVDMSLVADSTVNDFSEFWKSAIANDVLSLSNVEPINWNAYDTPESLCGFKT